MKFKTDFVTNSSSASIILIIKSEHKTVEEFREVFNKFIEEYKGGGWGTPHPIHFWDGSKITKKGKDTFHIEDYTSMFNNAADDIPHYMQALYLQWSVDPGSVEMQLGFKSVEIKVTDEN